MILPSVTLCNNCVTVKTRKKHWRIQCFLLKNRLKTTVGASGGNRTRMPAMNEATDFKSVVSTNFTTEAHNILWHWFGSTFE